MRESQKSAGTAQSATEHLLRQIAANIREVVWMSQPKMERLLYVSPAFEQIWGRSCESLQENPHIFLETVIPEDRRKVEAYLDTQSRENVEVEYRIQRPDGSIRWIRDRAFPIRDEAGQVQQVTGIAEDITERKRDEEIEARLNAELQLHRKRVDDLLASVPGVVWEAWGEPNAATQRIDFVSHGVEDMLGYSVEEWLTSPNFWLTIVHPDDKERAGRRAAEIFTSGKGGANQFRWIAKDGRILWVDAEAVVIHDEGGRPAGMRGVTLDVTERKRSEIRGAAFSTLGHRLSGTQTAEEAARIIVEVAEQLFGWDACYLHLFTNDHSAVIPVLHFDTVEGKRIPVAGSYIDHVPSPMDQQVLTGGKKLILRDQCAFDNPSLIPFGDRSRPSAALMFVPIGSGNSAIGVLSIQSYRSQAYTSEDLETLQALADHCGGALERLNAEQMLRESENRLRTIIEAEPECIKVVDREGRLHDMNPAGLAMIEANSLAQVRGSLIHELIVPRDRPAYVALLENIFQGRTGTLEFEITGLKGARCWLQTQMVPLRNERNEITACLGLTRDVTERKRAEEALRASEERFSKAFHATPISIAIATMGEGEFLDVNEGFCEMFGFERGEVIGKTAIGLGLWLRPDERLRLIQRLQAERTVRNFECRLRTKFGEIREALISAEIIELDREPCLLFITHDMTERLRLENQLRHSQKMEAVGQLAAGVAHDFNNIMTIVQGHAGLLLAGSTLDPTLEESLNKIMTASERATNLTRQLLAFSRKQTMQPSALDLSQVIQNLVKLLRRLLGDDIALEFFPSAELSCIWADAGMIDQVILNLAVNARDAMPKGGGFTIRTSLMSIDAASAQANTEARVGEFVRLTVADTGAGMDAAIVAKSFEPFFTTKEVGKGSGLGLSMVYGIMKQHEGWVEVSSKVGQGTVFELFFPKCEKPKGTAAPAWNSQLTDGGSEKILVVEDEPALRHLVTHLLERQGYRVWDAGSGSEALNVWRNCDRQIDLLLTDVMMPGGISGVDLAEQLQSEKPALKVIFTSGYEMDGADERFDLHEGVNFLPKPYHPPTLSKMVRDCLDGRLPAGAKTTN